MGRRKEPAEPTPEGRWELLVIGEERAVESKRRSYLNTQRRRGLPGVTKGVTRSDGRMEIWIYTTTPEGAPTP